MVFDNLYVAVLLISVLTGFFLTYYAWKKRDKTGSLLLTLMLASITLWSAGTLTTQLVTGAELSRFIYTNVTTAAIAFTPVLFFLFILEYVGKEEYLSRRNIALILIVPAAALILAWTNPYHHIYWQKGAFEALATEGTLSFGVGYYSLLFYQIVLTIAAFALLVKRLVNPKATYRKQVLALILAAVFPWTFGLLYFVTPINDDLTPIGFALTGVTITLSIFYDGLIDIVPLARDNLVDKIDTGIAVIDNDGKITDINSATKEMLDIRDDGELVGKSVEEVLADYPALLRIYDDITPAEEDFETEFSLNDDAALQHYQVLVSPLYDNRGKRIGQSFVINDITKQKWREEELREHEQELGRQRDELKARKSELERQKQKLEHQNERLDEFASIVSHDLRNPLNVAEGYTDMLAEDVDGKEVDEVRTALERMEKIINDSLMLARQGKAITETEEVDVLDIAREAWDNVDTGDGELETEPGEIIIDGDPGRLLNLFENLFRNAVEHNEGDVTVSVGECQNGFYVEDDGRGIPPDERDDVLQHGYTTSDEGVGLGLSIVNDIAEGHGLSLKLRESDEGGARFEVLGSPRQKAEDTQY